LPGKKDKGGEVSDIGMSENWGYNQNGGTKMTITIEPLLGLQVTDIKVNLKFPPDMVLALFFGYLVMDLEVPTDIQRMMDATPIDSFPQDWRMVLEMWFNRNVAIDVKEVYGVILPWIKEAL
jgi:D-alanyl-lipoteichoic acid acyltransferase DltB (MBOAT superfamily)